MSKISGRIWPYSIGASITLVFGFCVATVVVTQSGNLQSSDEYMLKYQEADLNANTLIAARIEFDKKYKISYISNGLQGTNSSLSYKITDIADHPVNDAELIVAISRPETHEFNKKLVSPSVKEGVYTFSNLTFEKEGVWNLVSKVKIGDDYRFYNIKADTRSKEAYEY